MTLLLPHTSHSTLLDPKFLGPDTHASTPHLHEEEYDLAGDVPRDTVDVHVPTASDHVDELYVVHLGGGGE